MKKIINKIFFVVFFILIVEFVYPVTNLKVTCYGDKTKVCARMKETATNPDGSKTTETTIVYGDTSVTEI